MNILYVALGGALGTLSRYYVTGWVAGWNGAAGLGVFAVNIAGSFVIGLFLTLATERFMWPPELRLAVAVGFVGGFTTFSSLAWETLGMLQVGNLAGATLNIVASVVCGMLAVYAGSVIGKAI